MDSGLQQRAGCGLYARTVDASRQRHVFENMLGSDAGAGARGTVGIWLAPSFGHPRSRPHFVRPHRLWGARFRADAFPRPCGPRLYRALGPLSAFAKNSKPAGVTVIAGAIYLISRMLELQPGG